MYALSCMPVRTSHACTGPSALLAPNTTSSRKSDTAAIAGAESGGAPLEMAEAHFFTQALVCSSFLAGQVGKRKAEESPPVFSGVSAMARPGWRGDF